VILAPSILSADFSRLGQQVSLVMDSGVRMIHVDVMDGHFVPNMTIGPDVVRAIRRVTKLPLDVHLMIEKPERYLGAFAEAGADWLGVHVLGGQATLDHVIISYGGGTINGVWSATAGAVVVQNGGTVTISAQPEGAEFVVIQVRDNGRGIPKEHLAEIFEPFFTTKEGENGVGLGLPVVYGIATRHHGTVTVDSTPGQGTVFAVRLPLHQPVDASRAGGEKEVEVS